MVDDPKVENFSVNMSNYKTNQTVVDSTHQTPSEANTFGLGQINMKKKIHSKLPSEKLQS